MNSNNFAAQLAALSQDFTASLPGRLADMEHTWQALSEGLDEPDHQQQMKNLHRAVHGITGAAGSFGLVELSTVCRRFEQFLKPYAGSGETLNEEERLRGDMLLQAIRAQLDTSQASKKDST